MAQQRADNARFFPEGDVPRLCLTQGLGTIREAKLAVLVAMGENKAAAVQAMVGAPAAAAGSARLSLPG